MVSSRAYDYSTVWYASCCVCVLPMLAVVLCVSYYGVRLPIQVGPARSVDQPFHGKEGRDQRPTSHVPRPHPPHSEPPPEPSERPGRLGGGAKARLPPPRPPPYLGERNHKAPSGQRSMRWLFCLHDCVYLIQFKAISVSANCYTCVSVI